MYKAASRFIKSLDRSRVRSAGPGDDPNVFERVRAKQAAKYEAKRKRPVIVAKARRPVSDAKVIARNA